MSRTSRTTGVHCSTARKYETQWNNLHRPCALCACGGGKSPNFIIGELGPGMPVNLKSPNLGPRLTIVDARGKRIGRLGGEDGPGIETGKFLAPHGIALDSKGDIYLGEVGVTTEDSCPDTPMPRSVWCAAQKLEKTPERSQVGTAAGLRFDRRPCSDVRSVICCDAAPKASCIPSPTSLLAHARSASAARGAARIAADFWGATGQGFDNVPGCAVQFDLGGAGFLGRKAPFY